MNISNRVLILGGILCFLAAMLHVVIIIGGAEWYRFFGAGEEIAQLSEQGSIIPTIVTGCIASILIVWGLYALSGAEIIFKLPFIKIVLFLIALILLLRGVIGIPVILLSSDPYALELKDKMIFMIFSSIVSISIGLCYAVGLLDKLRLNENKIT